MTTDQLLELEILTNKKYGNFKFTPLLLDRKNNIVLINDLDFVNLLELTFPDSYTVTNNTISVDFNIFKILQIRYFRHNETIQIFE